MASGTQDNFIKRLHVYEKNLSLNWLSQSEPFMITYNPHEILKCSVIWLYLVCLRPFDHCGLCSGGLAPVLKCYFFNVNVCFKTYICKMWTLCDTGNAGSCLG